MTYTLIVINQQGASQESDYATKQEARAAIRSWSDPEKLKARVWTSDGEQIYDGSALGF